jgi:DNA-binding CsgD family transcriptional regulator
VDPDFAGLRYNLVGTVVEVLLAEGEAEQAHAWIRARLVTDADLDPRAEVADLVFVARVLAERLQAARDRRDPETEQALLQELDGWERGFGPVLDTPVDGGSGSGSDVHLARAELARCRRRPDAGTLWLRAAQQSRRLGLRWDLAHCLWRAAEAEIDRGGDRLLVGDLLREVHALAREMGAAPLAEQVEFLARTARISLRAAVDVGVPVAGQGDLSTDGYGPLAALTGREREILGHLVAGRTNGEIAHALTISDKTVSVHVSNILRKTGTSTRVEAAALARRMA